MVVVCMAFVHAQVPTCHTSLEGAHCEHAETLPVDVQGCGDGSQHVPSARHAAC
jgi:hypothetical protein